MLKGISLEVPQGETLVLLGLSGSGKTTTLKLINGLEKPDQGLVFFEEQALAQSDLLSLRRKMGYVIQEGGLFPHYTVFENVALVPRLLKWDEERIKNRYRLLLEKLQLNPEEYYHQYPDQLSGGQQQRIGLARALAANPPVLLMDEPFGALDPITRASVRQEFLKLDELREKTIVLVTHDVQEAFELGDRIALMDEGRIVQIGKPAELLDQPVNDFVQSFMAKDHWWLRLKEAGLDRVMEEAFHAGNFNVEDLKSLIQRGS